MKTLTGYEERIQEENPNLKPPATEEVSGKTQDRVRFTYVNGTGESESPSPEGAPKGTWYYDMIPRAATEKPGWKSLGLAEREIYRIHCSHYNRTLKCSWESIKTQEEESGLSKKTVIKANRNLVKYGFVTIGKRKNKKGGAHNVYYLPDMITLLSQLEAAYIRKLDKEKANLLQSPPSDPNQFVSPRGSSPNPVGVKTTPTTPPVGVKTTPRLVENLHPNYTTELNKAFNNNNPVVVSQDILNRLNSLFPNNNGKVNEIIQTYPVDHIEKRLRLTEERTKRGENNNPPGFFLASLKKPYESPESARERITRELRKRETEAKKKKTKEARREEEAEEEKQKDWDEKTNSLSLEDDAFWTKGKQKLEKIIDDPQVSDTHIPGIHLLSRTKEKTTLLARTPYYKEFFEENYLPQIKQAWAAISGSPTEVEFVTL